MSASPDREPSIGQLVSGAIADVQTLVKDQIELTKADMSKSAKEFGNSAGMLIAAGVLSLIGFIFLLVTAAYALSLWLPLWASFLIVAVVVLIVAALLGLLGKRRIDKGRAIAQSAVSSAKTTQAALQADVKRLTGSGGASAPALSAAPAHDAG